MIEIQCDSLIGEKYRDKGFFSYSMRRQPNIISIFLRPLLYSNGRVLDNKI